MKTQVFSEEATKELVDLLNDYSKDSDFKAVIELLLSDANSNARDNCFTVWHCTAWH
jgi:hypothetical protein